MELRVLSSMQWLRHDALTGVGVAVVCGVIVLCALWAWFAFRRRIGPATKQLKRRVETLRTTDSEEAFAANFADLNEEFSRCPVIGHAWREFTETLIEPPPDDERERYLNPYPADQFFNRQVLLEQLINLRFYNTVPNFLTGAGILGTFVGLVFGISMASRGLGSNNIADAKSALESLLNGASLAFYTSIVGLTSSILFSWVEKHYVHRFDEVCSKWIELLDERLERITPESVAQQSLTQSREQTRALKQFSEDLAYQMTQALEKVASTVANPMQTGLDALFAQLHQMRADQAKGHDEVMERLIQEFSASISGAAGTEMQALAQTMESMGSGLEVLLDRFTQAASGVGQTVGNIQHLTTHTGELAHDIEQLISAVKVAQTAQQDLAGIADPIRAASREFAKTATEMKEWSSSVSTGLLGLLERFDTTASALGRTVDNMAQMTSQTSELTEGLGRLVGTMQAAQQDLAGTVGPIRAAGEQFATTAAAMQESAKTMSSGSQNLVTAVDNLAELQTDFRTTAAGMQESAETMSTGSQNLVAALDNLAELQADMRRAWADYQSRFENVDSSLGHVFESLDHGLKQYAETTNAYMQQLDEQAAKVVRELAGAVQQLEETIADFTEMREAEEPTP